MTSLAKKNIRKARIVKFLQKIIGLDATEIIENSTTNLSIIEEALTHTSAQKDINHEQLEFLGDAVLRLAASEFIERNFSGMKVGERSNLRSHLVSDKWLTEVGEKINIESVLMIGPKALGDQYALQTIQAETTEALIGGLYKCFDSLKIIHDWLTPYWKEKSFNVLEDPHRQNFKSALQEWSQGAGLEIPQYTTKEIIKTHGDPKRFLSKTYIQGELIGKGWGNSRKEAEKKAAESALNYISIKKPLAK